MSDEKEFHTIKVHQRDVNDILNIILGLEVNLVSSHQPDRPVKPRRVWGDSNSGTQVTEIGNYYIIDAVLDADKLKAVRELETDRMLHELLDEKFERFKQKVFDGLKKIDVEYRADYARSLMFRSIGHDDLLRIVLRSKKAAELTAKELDQPLLSPV